MPETALESRALLIIDQEPIRRQSTNDLHAAYQKLRILRAQVSDFESIDKPAFGRWLRSEFNDQLNELAKLQSRLFEAEEIVSEVQMVRFALGCSYYDAYVNTIERRQAGEDFDEEIRRKYQSSIEDDFEAFEDEKPKAKKSRHSKTDSVDEAATEQRADENLNGTHRRSNSEDEDTENSLWSKLRHHANQASETLKQNYRELARLLHPDLNSGGDEWSDELWSRTQTAYQSGDDQELTDLLVLARVSVAGSDTETTVWDIRKATALMKKTLRRLRQEVNLLRQDLAWGFTSTTDRVRLRRKISYDLEYQQDEIAVRLENIEAQLARWSVPTRRSHKGRRRTRSRSSYDLEIDF